MASPRLALTVIGLLVAALAACGSEPDPEADYRSEVNQICSDAIRAAQNVTPPRSPDAFAPYISRILELSKQYDRRFERVEAPPSMRAAHADLLRLNERGERVFEQWRRALVRGADPLRTLRSRLAELDRLLRDQNALARKAGLDDCVQSLPAPGQGPIES